MRNFTFPQVLILLFFIYFLFWFLASAPISEPEVSKHRKLRTVRSADSLISSSKSDQGGKSKPGGKLSKGNVCKHSQVIIWYGRTVFLVLVMYIL